MHDHTDIAPNKLAAAYLAQVDAALSDLHPARREEIAAQIREHLAEVLEKPGGASEAEVRSALDRLGSPSDIAAESRRSFADEAPSPAARYAPEKPVSSAAKDVWALILLPLGGLFYILPWFIGVTLLWRSKTWTQREKLLGTLVLPFGLAPTMFYIMVAPDSSATMFSGCSGESCSPGLDWTRWLTLLLFLAGVFAPICSVSYLAWRRGQRVRQARS